MKKTITTTIATALVSGSVIAGGGATVDFASAYVFRGSTFNDGFVIQPGVEYDGFGIPEEYGSVAVGAWGNIDIGDYNNSLTTSQFSEIDWYAGYSLPALVEGLDLSIGYTEYTYPLSGNATTAPTPADKEINLGAGYAIGDTGIGVGATYYRMIGGSLVEQDYLELSASYGLELSEGLEGSVGALVSYINQSKNTSSYNNGGADDGLNTLELDASLSYALNDTWSIGASVAYIGQLDDEVLVDVNDTVGSGSYDTEFLGVFSVGAAF